MHLPSPKSSNRSGFTLIELLVVVAIVITLAGLTVVLVKKGMESARSARCVSNLKEVCNTAMAAPADMDGFLVHPDRTAWGDEQWDWSLYFTVILSEGGVSFDDAQTEVEQHMRTFDIFQCPTAVTNADGLNRQHGHRGWRTYALNNRIGQRSGQGGGEDQVEPDGVLRPDQLEDPSVTICAGESSLTQGGYYRTSFGPESSKPRPGGQGMADHHGGGFHIGFFDGHVEHFRTDDFYYNNNSLDDGRTVRVLDDHSGGQITPNEKHWSVVWRGAQAPRN